MYQLGHYGAALVAYAPIGSAAWLAGNEAVAVVGCGVTVALSTLPDCDQRIPTIDHRGVTHTVLFAVLVGVALAGIASVLVGEDAALGDAGVVGFAFVVGTVAIGSHLLADLLTPMGIAPFWPVSRRRYSLSITPAKNPLANYLLLALGVVVTVASAIGVSLLS